MAHHLFLRSFFYIREKALLELSIEAGDCGEKISVSAAATMTTIAVKCTELAIEVNMLHVYCTAHESPHPPS